MKSIEVIFNEVKKKYKLGSNAHLASGGLVDVKGPGKSDVDIVFITKDYEHLEKLFPGATKDPDSKHQRVFWIFKHGGREVSICATNSDASMRSVIHRRNEKMLNQFPLIKAAAIAYKMNGHSTEPAYAKALGLTMKNDDEAYDLLMMPTLKLKAIAKARELRMKKVHSAS